MSPKHRVKMVRNNLFWYKDGTYTELPYKFENGKLQFFPPDNFVELLNELKAK